MRAVTQYQVYNADTDAVIETYASRNRAYDRVDFEAVHGTPWAAVRTVTVREFQNIIFVKKEAISC